MPNPEDYGWGYIEQGNGSTWQGGLIPYCDQPPRDQLPADAIVYDSRWDRWFWTNNANPLIPQSVRDAVNAHRDPCKPRPEQPPADDGPPPPAPLPPLPDDTPTEFARTYNDVCAALNQSNDELDAVVDELIRGAADDLTGSKATLDSALDEIIGDADNDLQKGAQQLAAVVNKVMRDAEKQSAATNGELAGAGANVPWSPATMEAALNGDWANMLANAFPQMGAALGVQPQPLMPLAAPNPMGGPGIQLPGMGMPAPAPGAPAAPDDGPNLLPVLSADELLDMGFGPSMEGPVPEPVLPLRAGSESAPLLGPQDLTMRPTATGQTVRPLAPSGKDKDECCPDVNVTVNVPPITLPANLTLSPAPAGPPSPPPPPAVPPAGTPYEGRPPAIMLIDGRVSYNVDNGRYEWTGTAPAEPPTTTINLNAPTATAPAPAPAATPVVTPSSLLFPLKTTGYGTITGVMPNWSQWDACETVGGIVAKLKPDVGTGSAKGTTDAAKTWMEQALGIPPGYADGLMGDPVKRQFKTFFDQIADNTSFQFDLFKSFTANAVTPAIVTTLLGDATANVGAAMFFGTKIATAATIEANTHFPANYLAQSTIYSYQWSNPQFLPTQIQINDAFLRGHINEQAWECWTRANGNLPEPFRNVMLADQVKPGLSDLIELHRRGVFDEKILKLRARTLGVLHPGYVDEWLEATKQLPTQSDLIRFMVRDSADKTVVDKYGYDTDFTQKFTPQIKQWAKALGLDETYFLYSWRSHWDIPSYTQLTEMIARLRPDRLEVKEWEKAHPDYKPGADKDLDKKAPRKVTREDVRQALQINDMAPGWVQPLIDISYTPINRTDAIRAYNTGAFSEEQLKDAFLNVRYSERDADTMVAFYKRDKERRLRNVTGSWSPRKVVNAYKQHLISHHEAYKLLVDVLPSVKLVEQTLDEAELDMAVTERAAALRALKRQFMLGEYDENGIKGQLVAVGIDGIHIQRIVDVWKIEREGRRKLPTVAMLSKWLHASIISVEEARTRLINLGYSMLDADRIIAAALKMDYEGMPPSNEELSDAITGAIKDQRAARRATDTTLQGRLSQILREAARLYREINRRADNRQEPPMGPITIP